MKVQINDQKKEEEELKFPCLMISSHVDNKYSIILLANGMAGDSDIYMCGMNLRTGEYSSTWIAHSFKPFNGSITLSND